MTNPEPDLSHHTSQSFPIVGIGASAGGLQALKDFFTHMPTDSGMAFVVIMHLSPNHESQAAEVLQTTTGMSVKQVTQTMKVERNHVYVIPPSKSLHMSDGEIIPTELQPLHGGKQVSIDLFFRTLAETHKETAIGIVLSGMGSDGTNGLKRIKEHNGFSFAQEPREAEHSSMPTHAINSQLVDFVMPVALMPAKLIELSRNATRIKLPPEKAPASALSQADQDEAALREILALMRTQTGHDFTHYRRVTVLRRISRRLQVHQLQQLSEYRDFIREHQVEAKALLKDLLISVTNFFRDHQVFAEFEKVAVPAIFADKSANDQVRVWVAGCATGEEAYSVGMLLFEFAEKLPNPPSIQIFATDIDEDAIRIARDGFYTETIQADVSPERLNHFFIKESGGYRIKKELRDCVLFAVHNLLKDPPFLKLSAITCRNLLIYLNRDAQRHLFELFHFVLVPGGWLLLGNSESLDTKTDLFSTLDKKLRIYQAKNGRRDRLPTQNFRFAISQPLSAEPQEKSAAEPSRIPIADFHRKVLGQYPLPSVMVDESYEILHLSEYAGRFLRFASGEPSHNILKVIHPDLHVELHRLLLHAQQGKSSESARVRVKLTEGVRYVKISVRTINDEAEQANKYLLVLFDEVEEITDESSEASQNTTGPLVGLLEQELQRARDSQRASMEQYETQAEELKASNEELQAINEELRSATEELETGKEELQSVNEEIQTVNAELKQKIDELAIANSDLQNLIVSTDLATLFIDQNLSIKFYTPRAREIFNLIHFDVGRSLSDITHNLDYADMLIDVKRVLEEACKIEREVRSRDGRWHLAQLIPYRVQADRTDGVILTFIDFTQRKLAEDQALSAKSELEHQAVYLKETNAKLEKEISERQLIELERGKLLRRLVFAQEEERSRIAREMHDQFGQLTVLNLKLEQLKRDCGDNVQLCEQVEVVQTIAQQLDDEVDNLIWEMRPTALDDLGLEEALKSFVQKWSIHLGIAIDFHATGIDPTRLTLETETVLYRIAQEALNNVTKHAQATRVAIVLERRRGQVSLIIEDDGVGFDIDQLRDRGDLGLGLIGMRERAALLGGTIDIETQPNQGTTVVVRIPLLPVDPEAKDE